MLKWCVYIIWYWSFFKHKCFYWRFIKISIVATILLICLNLIIRSLLELIGLSKNYISVFFNEIHFFIIQLYTGPLSIPTRNLQKKNCRYSLINICQSLLSCTRWLGKRIYYGIIVDQLWPIVINVRFSVPLANEKIVNKSPKVIHPLAAQSPAKICFKLERCLFQPSPNATNSQRYPQKTNDIPTICASWVITKDINKVRSNCDRKW